MALFSIPTNQSDSGNMGVSGLRLRNLDPDLSSDLYKYLRISEWRASRSAALKQAVQSYWQYTGFSSILRLSTVKAKGKSLGTMLP